ncbi:MAG: phenylalanine--tRNA ligase subunit beta [Anaerolineales bacterium]
MKVPLSWLKEYVDIEVSIEELAARLTLAGLEVEGIRFVGLPFPEGSNAGAEHQAGTAIEGLAWDREKIVVGEILEVMPHPNADRLVLCRLHDGSEEHTVLTGAPNIFEYLGEGELDPTLKVAYARQGARLYDGHQAGWQLMTLEPATIRGVKSSSMVCSEKELGISEDHEGIILLDDDAVPGTPLADYMGDAVLDIAITPNIARDANILGVAREVAALFNVKLHEPALDLPSGGESIDDKVSIEIEQPELNPRFVAGLIEGIGVGTSPYWLQRRLKLSGVRPINNIVDATNYVMLEIGEPLHAFDYDVLIQRAGDETPAIITRTANEGESLTTLDGVERELDPFTVLVTDAAGPLSIAGVMGGEESEVNEGTTRVLLEGAAWEFINIRQTTSSQRLNSEAAYRFSRGVHPSLAEKGVRRGLRLMHELAGGTVAEGLADAYPLPPATRQVSFPVSEVQRWLGLDLDPAQVAALLEGLDFSVQVESDTLTVVPPDYRLDIGEGVIGMSDVMEEIARLYGYDRIPARLIEDEIPQQPADVVLQREERVRDLLVNLGLQEVVSYRLTTPEREARARAPGSAADEQAYTRLANPISSEREVMRHSLLASMLEVIESNAKVRQRIAVFEVGPVYLPRQEGDLPAEPTRLAIGLHGKRGEPTWLREDPGEFGFFDLKGVVEELFEGLGLEPVSYHPAEHPSFHPGKCATVGLGDQPVGVIGELHPLVAERYEFQEAPVVAATFDLEAIIAKMGRRHDVQAVPAYPPVLEDLAVVVDETVPAAKVEAVIREAAGDLVSDVRLFDLFRGEQIGAGKKSLAYSLVYQAQDRTLTDDEVAAVRAKVVDQLASVLSATLRS